MSQERVDFVRSLYEAFGRGDIQTVLAGLDPQVEWREADNFIYADDSPYIGPQAVLEGVFARLGGEWDGFTVSPDEILDAGDTVVAHGYYGGAYKKTGERVRAQFAHFFTFGGDKVVKFQEYTDTAQFLRAVGR